MFKGGQGDKGTRGQGDRGTSGSGRRGVALFSRKQQLAQLDFSRSRGSLMGRPLPEGRPDGRDKKSGSSGFFTFGSLAMCGV